MDYTNGLLPADDVCGTLEAAQAKGNRGLGVMFAPPVAMCVNAHPSRRMDAESETLIPIGGCFDVAHSLRADGFDASEGGTGRGTPLVAFGWQNSASQGASASTHHTPTLDKSKTPAIAFDMAQITHPENRSKVESGAPAPTMNAKGQIHAATSMTVRRLTPTECERLQGFPDGYTQIPYRGKPAADGPRYKALGNSMAVPVIAWIGRQIELAEAA